VSRFRTLPVGLLLLFVLGSCSIVDNFSGRTVNFNLEAEQAQLQTLLLNIVRASLSRPMQFTSLSSITGTQSMSGSTSLLIPFGHHRPAAVASPDQLTPSATVSASPTFTVPVLDTQEFYQGELTPLTGQEYHFFVEEGYTPAQLLYLFANSIELTTVDKTPQHFTFSNYVGNDYDFQRFAIVADYLLSLGLTLEQTRRSQRIGPPLTAAELQKDPKGLADLATAGYQLMLVHSPAAGGSGTSSMTPAPAAPTPKAKPTDTAKPTGKAKPTNQARSTKLAVAQSTERYQLEKSTTSYRPCFDPGLLAMTNKASLIDKSLVCSSMEAQSEGDVQTDGTLTRPGGFYAPDLVASIRQLQDQHIQALRATGDGASIATAAALAHVPLPPANAQFQLRIYTRSTEGILFYLGSVVARHLHPSPPNPPREIQVKVGEPYLPYPATPCPPSSDGVPQPIGNYLCQNLFAVDVDSHEGHSPLAVEYEDKTYSIPADPNMQGRTLRLVDLVKQLLALHTSAKSLPASNVLNIIGTTP
jgi:hypothetical protein